MKIDITKIELNQKKNILPDTLKTPFTLEIKPGTFHFIIGESGTGKSISALAVSDLLDKRDWDIEKGDDHSYKAEALGKELTYIFQEPKSYLNPCLKIKEQLWEVIDSKEEVKTLLEYVELDEDKADSYPHQISGGERQRIMIAMAIAGALPPRNQKVSLLIADEPTSSLDFENQANILELLNKLLEEKIINAVLFITHDQLLIDEYWKKWKDERCCCYDFAQRKEYSDREQLKKRIQSVFQDASLYDKLINQSPRKPVLFNISGLSVTHKKDGKKILDQIGFKVNKNEIVGLVGTSGCGKTTIINYILDILPNQQWKIQGKKRADPDIEKNSKKLQAIFQDPDQAFNPNMSIYEIFYESFKLYGNKENKFLDWLNEQLKKINFFKKNQKVEDVIYKYPGQFSGGEKQKLALLRALIPEPLLIVADEPFSRLDMKNKFEMAYLMKREQARKNLSYIIASHDLQTSAYLCDRIIILQKREKEQPAKEVNIAVRDDSKWKKEKESSPNAYVDNIIQQLNIMAGWLSSCHTEKSIQVECGI
jgi:ABC-type glutathione transport system ATPase component